MKLLVFVLHRPHGRLVDDVPFLRCVMSVIDIALFAILGWWSPDQKLNEVCVTRRGVAFVQWVVCRARMLAPSNGTLEGVVLYASTILSHIQKQTKMIRAYYFGAALFDHLLLLSIFWSGDPYFKPIDGNSAFLVFAHLFGHSIFSIFTEMQVTGLVATVLFTYAYLWLCVRVTVSVLIITMPGTSATLY